MRGPGPRGSAGAVLYITAAIFLELVAEELARRLWAEATNGVAMALGRDDIERYTHRLSDFNAGQSREIYMIPCEERLGHLSSSAVIGMALAR